MQVNPKGNDKATCRVNRGGSFTNAKRVCRATDRFGLRPTAESYCLGFRIVMGSKSC